MWAYWLSFILETALAIVAFLVVTTLFQPVPLTWAIVEFTVFLINVGVWLTVSFCCTLATGRGSVLLRSNTVYFAITSVTHFVLSAGWIVYLSKFLAAVTPLTWTANAEAYGLFRDLFLIQLLAYFVLTVVSLFDARFARVRRYMKSMSAASSRNSAK